jgi:ribosomal protein S18 acetylase RimI-like enzyme|tara:strand:+ start:383690 stop:384280 length:591 start_codon:yes stop_codon:yes gene_type:complete
MKNLPKIKIDKNDIISSDNFDNGDLFHIVALNKTYLQTMMIFQKMILESLDADEKSFFLEKSEGYLTQHFNNGSKAVGVVSNNKLLGQALITQPTDNHPETGMTDMANLPAATTVSVIQGVGVHPSTRGMKIGDKLIAAWLDIAANDKRVNALAETDQNNKYSWSLFVKNDVDIVSEGVDPDDGTKLYNHHKVLKI